MNRLTRNAVECVRCHTIVESKTRHDFRAHSCAPDLWFFVDGGLAYSRRGWGNENFIGKPEDHYIERSEYETRDISDD